MLYILKNKCFNMITSSLLFPWLLNSTAILSQHASLSLELTDSVFLYSITSLYCKIIWTISCFSAVVKFYPLFLVFTMHCLLLFSPMSIIFLSTVGWAIA